MAKFVDGDFVLGTISHAVIVEDKKGKLNIELGFTADKQLLEGSKDGPSENVTPFDSFTRLFIDDVDIKEDDDKDAFDKGKVRRGITRDALEAITGERLDDAWSDKGYQRLTPDHKNSLIPLIVGKEVVLKAREFGTGIMWNVFTPRPVPKAMTLAEIKAKLRAKQTA